MDNFGILTLIPPIVIIVFALVTKRTFEALLIGAVIGFFMTDKWGVPSAEVQGLLWFWEICKKVRQHRKKDVNHRVDPGNYCFYG